MQIMAMLMLDMLEILTLIICIWSGSKLKRSVFSTFCILILRITLNFKKMVLLGGRTTEGKGKIVRD